MFQRILGLYRQAQRVCVSLLPELWDAPSEAASQVCDPDAVAGVRLNEKLLRWFISYPSQSLASSQLGLTRATMGLKFPFMVTERDPLSRWESEDAKKKKKKRTECKRHFVIVHLSGLQSLRAAVES